MRQLITSDTTIGREAIIKLLGGPIRKAALAGLLAVVSVVVVSRLMELHRDKFYEGARSPYLQLSAMDAMLVRWQTLMPVEGVIHFGLDPGNLNRIAEEGEEREKHSIELSGLEPGGTYFYAIGDPLHGPHHGDHFRFTMPDTSERDTTSRIWVLGDPGKKGPDQAAVRDAAYSWLERNRRSGMPRADLVVTLGDNAYRSGANEQFQKNFFEPYQDMFRSTPLLPAYGNHDDRRDVFFDLFDFPTEGQLGGYPSKSERYFSINYKDLHLIFLNSMAVEMHGQSKMVRWMAKDLSVNDRRWIIVVLHHPPYSKGSHDSDDSTDSDGRMEWVRQILVPVMEEGGVDLVLSGHSHGYERSYLINGHYGKSDSWVTEMFVSNQEYSEGLVYKTNTLSAKNGGTMYLVAGSSSKFESGTYDHPAMRVSKACLGSVVLDVGKDRLVSRFIDDKGQVVDQFSVVKSTVLANATR